MTDPFDVFDPFAPQGAAEEPESRAPAEEPEPRAAAEEREPRAGAGSLADSTPTPEPKGPRRWSAALTPPSPTFPVGHSHRAETTRPPSIQRDSFRSLALPALRAVAARLADRGHEVSIQDDFAADEPVVLVRFRPDAGPLGSFAAGTEDPARFELRLATQRDGSSEVVAGYVPATAGVPFAFLGRIPVGAVDARWISRRFVEFVERTLRVG
jgi:hypothetical protein